MCSGIRYPHLATEDARHPGRSLSQGGSQLQSLKVGFPIRRSPDQSLFAAPRGLSQRTTSFIASQRQGIHQMPFFHLIALIVDAQPGGTLNTPDGLIDHDPTPSSLNSAGDDGYKTIPITWDMSKSTRPRSNRLGHTDKALASHDARPEPSSRRTRTIGTYPLFTMTSKRAGHGRTTACKIVLSCTDVH